VTLHLNPFTPAPGKRFSLFDLWVYDLFYRRWALHFKHHPELRKAFLSHMQAWSAERSRPLGRLRAVPGPRLLIRGR